MLRLKLTLGLLATLIILLLVGIYGVWLFSDLGRAVDKVLRDNYDSIKVCHYMRTATARVNTFYSRGERPYPLYDQTETLDEVEKQFNARLPTLELKAKSEGERKLVAQLRLACADYIKVYRRIFDYFKEGGLSDPRIAEVRQQLPGLTLSITHHPLLGTNYVSPCTIPFKTTTSRSNHRSLSCMSYIRRQVWRKFCNRQ